ncbi:MAG: hypothetical protein JWN44_4751 [Myxococcales bacterium]|nr:hypothetical protein [Myxococcales bacterium]
MRLLPLAFVLAAVGCPAPDNSHGLVTTAAPAQLLDYNEFVCEVQPVLIRRCSFVACHGGVDHALRVYSPGKLRLVDSANAARSARDAMLSPDEVTRNFESATGTVYAAQPSDRQNPDDRVPILVKPTRASFGGSEHHGVGIFPVYPAQDLSQDHEYGVLAAWVAGKKATGTEPACADMFMTLGLKPR